MLDRCGPANFEDLVSDPDQQLYQITSSVRPQPANIPRSHVVFASIWRSSYERRGIRRRGGPWSPVCCADRFATGWKGAARPRQTTASGTSATRQQHGYGSFPSENRTLRPAWPRRWGSRSTNAALYPTCCHRWPDLLSYNSLVSASRHLCNNPPSPRSSDILPMFVAGIGDNIDSHE